MLARIEDALALVAFMDAVVRRKMPKKIAAPLFPPVPTPAAIFAPNHEEASAALGPAFAVDGRAVRDAVARALRFRVGLLPHMLAISVR